MVLDILREGKTAEGFVQDGLMPVFDLGDLLVQRRAIHQIKEAVMAAALDMPTFAEMENRGGGAHDVLLRYEHVLDKVVDGHSRPTQPDVVRPNQNVCECQQPSKKRKGEGRIKGRQTYSQKPWI